MRLQTLFESTGEVWVIVLDMQNGHFADDDLFSNMEIFGSEAAAVDRIFEHYDHAMDDGDEDLIAELAKMRKRNNTVEKALAVMDAYSSLGHLQDILMVQKKKIL